MPFKTFLLKISSLIASTHRLSLKAHCLEIDGSDCTPPIRYSWEIRRAGSQKKIANSEAFFSTGKQNIIKQWWK